MVTPLTALNPKAYGGKEEAKRRFAICQECPRFFKPTGTCRECGCFMRVKTQLEHATCPLEKW